MRTRMEMKMEMMEEEVGAEVRTSDALITISERSHE